MTRQSAPLPDPLLPERPTDARVQVDSAEWLFGPDWPGLRLLARRDRDGLHLTDATGTAVDDLTEATRLLDRAVAPDLAVLDGVWTAHPFWGADDSSAANGAGDEAGGEAAHAFVALDLLELEGEPLLDVPFQERHRLLRSVVRESVGVRVSPVVKQPITGWLGGWREQGFTHYLARHQNAPYRPGVRSDDWFRIPIVAEQPGGGFIGRLTGVRSRRPRRIGD